MSFSDWGINVAGVQGQPSGVPGLPGTGYFATSGTTFAIGTGSKSFVTETNLAYVAGLRVRAASQGNPTQWMEGVCTSYVGNVLVLNVDLTSASAIVPAAVALPGYIGGLTLARDTDVSNTRLDIAAGGATSDDNTTTMILPGAYIKNAAAPWAVGSGTGIGALDTGSLAANTWYHVFLIQRPDTGVVDVLVSASLTPTLPGSGAYQKQRRIGSIRTNASTQIMPFTQIGDEFLWTTAVSDLGGVTFGTTAVLVNVTVPNGIKVRALSLIYAASGSSIYYLVWSPDQTGSSLNNPGGNILFQSNLAGQILTAEVQIRTNTNSQFLFQASASGTNLYVVTKGWLDNRGK